MIRVVPIERCCAAVSLVLVNFFCVVTRDDAASPINNSSRRRGDPLYGAATIALVITRTRAREPYAARRASSHLHHKLRRYFGRQLACEIVVQARRNGRL